MGSAAPPIGSCTINTSVCMTTSKSYDVIGMEAKQVNFQPIHYMVMVPVQHRTQCSKYVRVRACISMVQNLTPVQLPACVEETRSDFSTRCTTGTQELNCYFPIGCIAYTYV